VGQGSGLNELYAELPEDYAGEEGVEEGAGRESTFAKSFAGKLCRRRGWATLPGDEEGSRGCTEALADAFKPIPIGGEGEGRGGGGGGGVGVVRGEAEIRSDAGRIEGHGRERELERLLAQRRDIEARIDEIQSSSPIPRGVPADAGG
jgi:hypothetical protein